MNIREHIEGHLQSTDLPLVAISLAAVPCPDTPVILTLHWHGFLRERLADLPGASPVSYRSVPSSAVQLNERWDDILDVDRATLDVAWELGAWDVARAERPSCTRPGAAAQEAIDCLQAFGSFPYGVEGSDLVISEAPDADDLIDVAARHGYLTWVFRPVHGGIWKEVADDATLRPDGTREPPCPLQPVRPSCRAARRTVYRFGVAEGGLTRPRQ